MKSFTYTARIEWTGNDGSGTSTPRYGRDSELSVPGKPTLLGSAPVEFGGNGVDWAPEDLLVAAVGQCHLLTYLFVCSRNGIVVSSYRDEASGILDVRGADGGSMREIELRPVVEISAGDVDLAIRLHDDAHRGCYVGSSVAFPVRIVPTVTRV